MARIASKFQGRLDRRVFSAAMALVAKRPGDVGALSAQRDLDALRQFIGSPLLIALVDIPWTPIFVFTIFLFHPFMGWLAIAGGLFLIAVTLLNQSMTARLRQEANVTAVVADRFADQMKSESETVGALGMRGTAYDRWESQRTDMLDATVRAGDRSTVFSTISKIFRLFLQSAMLALGAWLVLQNELSAGAMIASSILLGRALAPIEMAIGQWPLAQQALQGWRRLSALLETIPADVDLTPLPKPDARLEIQQLSVAPPGERYPVLQQINFTLEPGQALGVIGPSASGKSSLARALIGAWPAVGGVIRLDGAGIGQYDPDVLGSHIGYLPQRVALFDGTIAENIARLRTEGDPAEIIAAAKRAGAHEMIVNLPEGYDTRVTANGGRLSGGQIQRIGLARALYGDPVMIVLDEPNSNLDNEGSVAINTTIRDLKAAGRIIMIMAHRPAALSECDLLLVLDSGRMRAFGPRDEVLRETVKNSTTVLRNPHPGGVA
jgi:ATP-binding cassette subfamily C protein